MATIQDGQIGTEKSPTWTGTVRIARAAWRIAITAKIKPETY
jgi:hypothetical protein